MECPPNDGQIESQLRSKRILIINKKYLQEKFNIVAYTSIVILDTK